MNKQEALNKIEELKEYVDKLDEKVYEVKTPIDSDGNILFNKGKQRLCINKYSGVYSVDSVYQPGSYFRDARHKFVWVPCKLEDLDVGDTAYLSHEDVGEETFDNDYWVVKILIDNKYVSICHIDVEVEDNLDTHKSYYKLVRKEDL